MQLLATAAHPRPHWNPDTQQRLSEWHATQYLIHALEDTGESGAAELLGKMRGACGPRARDLAYRLYSICERKGWANEAVAYNSLVIAWPEISKLAQQVQASTPIQTKLFTGSEETR